MLEKNDDERTDDQELYEPSPAWELAGPSLLVAVWTVIVVGESMGQAAEMTTISWPVRARIGRTIGRAGATKRAAGIVGECG